MKVFGTGRLTKEIETKKIGDTDVCSFDIACYRDKDNSDFFHVTVWGKQVANCVKFLHKGSMVAISGRLQNDRYEKDGKPQTFTKIVAEVVEFMTPIKADASSPNAIPKATEIPDDNMPF